MQLTNEFRNVDTLQISIFRNGKQKPIIYDMQ